MVQLIVSILLYFVIFFGISFILNMLIRRTWVMAIIYPIIVVLIVDGISTIEYITNPVDSFATAGSRLVSLTVVDIIILASGFAGTIVSGFVIKFLRKSGYQMF
ncbi:YuiB family protein [Virgibacillus sp. W0181]|uniref:YuiB family protein n=1 Tax=Virgibacillus sp. W0181 TaxID=3391581 RepID=UPI003F475131